MIECVPLAEKFGIFLESSLFSTQALAVGCHALLWVWSPGALAEAFTEVGSKREYETTEPSDAKIDRCDLSQAQNQTEDVPCT